MQYTPEGLLFAGGLCIVWPSTIFDISNASGKFSSEERSTSSWMFDRAKTKANNEYVSIDKEDFICEVERLSKVR